MMRNHESIIAALFAAVLLLQAPAPAAAATATATALPSPNVAWLEAAADADIDRAFVQARAQKKPLLLYWGATWCPPCNQLKATLFNRQDFAVQSRSFVSVHVDGDRPGAQKLGRRFNVSGYPTIVLLTADGSEITRLPGEAEPSQVLSLMQLGLAGGRPLKTVLADAQAGRPLSAGEWKLLGFYSWETDEQQLVAKAQLPALLARLAAASPPADTETTTRLWLKALAAGDGAGDKSGGGVKADAALTDRVQRVLADPALTRLHFDIVANSAADIVRALAGDAAPDKSPLLPAFDAALQRLAQDATLSRGDRITALLSRIDLARLGLPKGAVQVQLRQALLRDVREQAARDDRDITDGYERQAVIPEAASALASAGLWADSEALLQRNLAQSHAPYYLMSQLGSNARKLGHKEEALRWYQQAFDKSEGPATRLQWGASYLGALVDLAPNDGARIEAAATTLFSEAGKDAGAFDGRSARSLQRIGAKLIGWNAGGARAASLKRLQSRLDAVCARTDAGDGRRETCQALLKPKRAA